MYYSVTTQANSGKEISSALIGSRTLDLLITSSDALPLSCRKLVGAKAFKGAKAINYFKGEYNFLFSTGHLYYFLNNFFFQNGLRPFSEHLQG